MCLWGLLKNKPLNNCLRVTQKTILEQSFYFFSYEVIPVACTYKNN